MTCFPAWIVHPIPAVIFYSAVCHMKPCILFLPCVIERAPLLTAACLVNTPRSAIIAHLMHVVFAVTLLPNAVLDHRNQKLVG